MTEQQRDELLVTMNEKLCVLSGKYGELIQKFEGLDQKFERLDQKFGGLDQKFEGLNQKYNDLAKGQEKLFSDQIQRDKVLEKLVIELLNLNKKFDDSACLIFLHRFLIFYHENLIFENEMQMHQIRYLIFVRVQIQFL